MSLRSGRARELAQDDAELTFEQLRRAVVSGSVVASFNVEAFSLERLRTLRPEDIETRRAEFQEFSRF